MIGIGTAPITQEHSRRIKLLSAMRFDNTLTNAGILCGNTHKLGLINRDPSVDDPKHSQTLFIRPAMFIEYRFGKLFERITADFAMPLRVVFWFGREFKLSS